MAESSTVECTPKNGAGDSERNNSQKRVPVPSSRKFTARAPPLDEGLKIRLKNALVEMEERPHKKVSKARSVAEIHPTKCKVKRRSVDAHSKDEVSVHVTPRPFEETTPTSSSGLLPKESFVCRFYQRLLLNAWRHSRARLTTITESSKRQKEQINQLEMQITLLKKLNKSEIQKRDEALVECQNTKNKLEQIQESNLVLCKNLFNLKMELDTSQRTLQNAQLEIKNYADQLYGSQESLRKKVEENNTLKSELEINEEIINSLNKKVDTLENSLNVTMDNLKNTETLYDIKNSECEDLVSQLENKTDVNAVLEEELMMYKNNNLNLEKHIEILQDELADNIARLEMIKVENESMKIEIEDVNTELNKEKISTWWKSTKQIASLSMSALDAAAHVMLPAYLD